MLGVMYFIRKRHATHDKMTTPQVVTLYNNRLTAAAADVISDSFIDTALTFYSRVVSIPALAELMRIADDQPNTPFDGTGGTPEGIAWLFPGMLDMHERGEIPEARRQARRARRG